MTNRIPVAEGLALDGDRDRPRVDDDGRDVDGVDNKCGHELSASCSFTVHTNTRRVM